MIDFALVQLLREHAGVGTRINPSTESVRVTVDLPRIVYSLIDSQREWTDDGATGLVEARYQLDIFADRVTDARDIADTLRTNLDGFKGSVTPDLPDVEGEEVVILRIHFDSERFEKGERAEGANKTVARFVQDIFVLYRE
jgi:Protein of unknown function (DUF3168)